MGHTDVVGVERDKWSVDPFGAVVKDGYLYGRGTLDNKDNAAVYLEVFLLLHRLRVPLDRDVIYLAQAGEEGASNLGIGFMVAQHWDKIDCEFALDEGGCIRLRDGRVYYVGVSATEKVPRGIRLIARGTSGHGSVPLADNAITHLAAAVAKAGSYQMPMRLNETTRVFFERLAAISPADEKDLYAHLEDPAQSAAVQEKIRATNPRYDSMLRTSISPTIIQGGFQSNVIPAQAEARLDIRAVPGEDIPAMVAALRRLIDDPAIELVGPSGGRPGDASLRDPDGYVSRLGSRAAETVPGRRHPAADAHGSDRHGAVAGAGRASLRPGPAGQYRRVGARARQRRADLGGGRPAVRAVRLRGRDGRGSGPQPRPPRRVSMTRQDEAPSALPPESCDQFRLRRPRVGGATIGSYTRRCCTGAELPAAPASVEAMRVSRIA